MANERITEDIVRNHFKNDPLFKSIKFEEQKSYNQRVIDLLQTASKSGKGIGKPEFIISFPSGNIDYLIVIECKASVTNHQSANFDNPKEYAVDGVLHYAKALSHEFDVVAIAVSGQTEQELLVSHFIWKKSEEKPTENTADKKLLSINNYLKLFKNEQFADNLRNVDIIQKAIILNNQYQNYSITEMTRCTMVSAILLSLLNEPFRISYKTFSSSESLCKAILASIETVLNQNEIRNKSEMLGEYSKILNEPIFKQEKIKHKNKKEHELSVEVAKGMIEYLHKNVYPLIDMEQSGFDVLGRFYTEFIRYAGSEKNQGLVLTPAHITDLFCDLANVTHSDVIYDPCCGTGGFLISGMKRMITLAGNDEEKKQKIKDNQLIGVELRPSMFTYACSNMMLRGDGKSNIYCGDCFALETVIKENYKPTIAFLNPPYDVGNEGQMRFVEHALNMVSAQNGTVVAIVQMSCGIKNDKELIAVKKRILNKHHLKAVLSMPDDLFYPVGVVTCIMIFEAGKSNTGRDTWFGYFKNDKFEKRKNQGRIDARGLFEDEKTRWLNAYHNSKEVEGLSVKKEVTAEEEWCAEAYMETDYSTICDNDFIKKMKEYVALKLLHNEDYSAIFECTPISKKIPIETIKWKWFPLDKELFKMERGTRLTKPNREKGFVPLITAGFQNSGIAEYIGNEEMKRYQNAITIDMFSYCFYREYIFCCDDNILVLTNDKLNKYSGLFIATILDNDNYKFQYGRQYRQKNFKKHKIKLPVIENDTPDWQFMENYIKSLPYSKSI